MYKRYVKDFKAKVALEAIRGEKTIQEIGAGYSVHPNLVSQWKKQLLDSAGKLFEKAGKDKAIWPPNQVRATDITYTKLGTGHAYLVAIIDLYSRKVLSWRVSNTLDAESCVAALEEAIAR